MGGTGNSRHQLAAEVGEAAGTQILLGRCQVDGSYERARRALAQPGGTELPPGAGALHTGCRPASAGARSTGWQKCLLAAGPTRASLRWPRWNTATLRIACAGGIRLSAGSPEFVRDERTRSILYRDRRGRPAVGITLLLQSHGIGNVRPNLPCCSSGRMMPTGSI